jgi:toxin ParE1/3/4
MPRVIYTRPAVHDLAEIRKHIARDNELISREFIVRIKEKCRKIASLPHIGSLREGYGVGVRGFPLSSYLIFYRKVNDGIAILRVVHGARDLPDAFHEDIFEDSIKD